MKNGKLSLPFQYFFSQWNCLVLSWGVVCVYLNVTYLLSHDAYRFNNNMKLRGIYFFINKENVLLRTDMSSYEFLLIEKWFIKKESLLWVMAVWKRETWRFHLIFFFFWVRIKNAQLFLYELSWHAIMDALYPSFLYVKKMIDIKHNFNSISRKISKIIAALIVSDALSNLNFHDVN